MHLGENKKRVKIMTVNFVSTSNLQFHVKFRNKHAL